MMNGRKSKKNEAAVGYDSDRKHLTGNREVERLIEAVKGIRNEARDRFVTPRNGAYC
jgi:spore cortex formation protein SpoVR/YcgB (stage V sporulation)